MKIEKKQPIKGRNSNEYNNWNENQNSNNFRRNNQQVQLLERERNPTDDQKVKAPFQNIVMDEDEDVFQEGEDDIHCVEGQEEESYLTQSEYEGALLDEQLNQNFDEGFVLQTDEKNRYNLSSKNSVGKQSMQSPPKKVATPAK